MNTKETGGAAFPAEMTLRDYFAAKAMQGMLALLESDYTPMTANGQKRAAEDAYGIAD